MKRIVPILCILVALTAVAVVNYDYVYGHLSDSPYTTHFCPLCSAFHAADLSQQPLQVLFADIFRCIRRFTPVDPLLSISESVLTSYTLRAPPLTAA